VKSYECRRCGAEVEAEMYSMLPDGQCSEGSQTDSDHRWVPAGYDA